MARTLENKFQISGSIDYIDSLVPGSSLEVTSSLQSDLNAIRSMLKDVGGEANWFDTQSTLDGGRVPGANLLELHTLVNNMISGTKEHSDLIVSGGGAEITGTLDLSGSFLAVGPAVSILMAGAVNISGSTVTADAQGGNLTLSGSGGQIVFGDSFYTPSLYSIQLPLAVNVTEWSNFATTFTATSSLLSAITSITGATSNIANQVTKSYYITTGTQVPDGNQDVGFAINSMLFATDDVNVFLNGVLLRSGSSFDVYEGDNSTSLKFTFKLRVKDLITVQEFGQ